MKEKAFRVRMTTKDGCLIQNREGDRHFWIKADGKLDETWAEMSLRRDCVEKGVRLVSYTHNGNEVTAIVEWL